MNVLPPLERGSVFSTLRSSEFRKNEEVQSLYVVATTAGGKVEVQVQSRSVDAKAVAPPQPISVKEKVKLAVMGLVFAAVFGFLWLGTVPLTSGAVASMFGLQYLSTLYGVVFLSHQIGSFLGAWLAGRLFDATGSYDAVWLTSIALGLFAAVVSALTRDAPVPMRFTAATA